MKYVAKSECETLDAARFALAGVDYVAVVCDGRVHTMPAEAFDLLYEPVTKEPKALPARWDPQTAKQPKTEGDSVTVRIIRILQEYGPQTHAELAERVYPELMPTMRGQRLWGMIHPLKAKGTVTKREHNGIDKWTLVRPEAA